MLFCWNLLRKICSFHSWAILINDRNYIRIIERIWLILIITILRDSLLSNCCYWNGKFSLLKFNFFRFKVLLVCSLSIRPFFYYQVLVLSYFVCLTCLIENNRLFLLLLKSIFRLVLRILCLISPCFSPTWIINIRIIYLFRLLILILDLILDMIIQLLNVMF